jgi:hypothetical protein
MVDARLDIRMTFSIFSPTVIKAKARVHTRFQIKTTRMAANPEG